MSAPTDRAGVVRVIRDGSDWLSTDRATRLLEHMEAAGLRVVPVEVLNNLRAAEMRTRDVGDTDAMALDRDMRHANAYLNQALDAASPFAPPQKAPDAG